MYSPKIKDVYIPVLYQLSKKNKKPMTVIVNEMIAEALVKYPGSINILKAETPKKKI